MTAKVATLVEIDTEHATAYYCKGHVLPKEFAKALANETDRVISNPVSIMQTYMRWVWLPGEETQSGKKELVALYPVEQKRGAFAVTVINRDNTHFYENCKPLCGFCKMLVGTEK